MTDNFLPYFKTLLLLSLLLIASQCCLNSSEKQGNCTQCEHYRVLVDGYCLDKPKGCNDVKPGKPIICVTCLNGYLLRNKECRRAAEVQEKQGKKVPQVAPLIPEKVETLQNKSLFQPQPGPQPSPSVVAPFRLPIFPRIRIVSQPEPEVPIVLQKQILQHFPHLFNYKLVEIGQKSLNKRLLIYQDGTILLASQIDSGFTVEQLVRGTLGPLLEKIKSQFVDGIGVILSSSLSINYNILINSTNEAVGISIDLANQNRRLLGCGSGSQKLEGWSKLELGQLYLEYLKWSFWQQMRPIQLLNLPDKINKIQSERRIAENGTVEQIRFKIFYVWEDVNGNIEQTMVIGYFPATNSSIFRNYLSNGKDIFEQLKIKSQNITSSLNASNVSNANNILKTSTNTSVVTPEVNTTATISQAINTKTSVNNQTVINNTSTQPGSNTSPSANNSTQPVNNAPAPVVNSTPNTNTTTPVNTSLIVSGNTTNSGNSNTTQINATNNGNSTIVNTNTTNTITNTASATNTTSSTSTSSNKPLLPAFNISSIRNAFNEKPSYSGSNLNSSEILKKPPLGSSYFNSTKNSAPLVSSPAELLKLIQQSSPNFQETLSQGNKPIYFSNKTCNRPGYQCYWMKLLTLNKVIQIEANENHETNQISVLPSIANDYSCADVSITEDAVAYKLDAYLRKTYPRLNQFSKAYFQTKLDMMGERYYGIYANRGGRKIIYHVLKAKNSLNYIITKSQLYNNGYSFQSQQMENLNLKITDLDAGKLTASQLGILKPLQSIVIELLSRYRSYIQDAVLTAVIINNSHAKLYLSSKFANFEYTKKIKGDDRGQFIMIQQKIGDHVLPASFSRDNLITEGSLYDDETFRNLRDILLNKYRNSLGSGTVEIYAQRNQNSMSTRSYDMAFKTSMGYYTLRANQTPFKSFSISPLYKVDELQENTKQKVCKINESKDKIDGRCYNTISNCYRQLGSYCLMCDPDYVLESGRKICAKSCNW